MARAGGRGFRATSLGADAGGADAGEADGGDDAGADEGAVIGTGLDRVKSGAGGRELDRPPAGAAGGGTGLD
jgi:hypothetical protein